MQRPERTMRRGSRPGHLGRRGGGRGLGRGCGSAGRAQRLPVPALRPPAWSPERERSAGETGRTPWAPHAHSGGRPGRQRLTSVGAGSPLRVWWQLWVLSPETDTRVVSPTKSGDTGPRSQACPCPTKSLRAPPPFFQSLLPPPRPAPEGMGVEPQKGAPCSPALATITRFVRRENQPGAGVSADSHPCSVLGSQSPGEFRRPPDTPSLSKPRNQSQRRCLGARLGSEMVYATAKPLANYFFKEAPILFSPKLKRKLGSANLGSLRDRNEERQGPRCERAGLRGPRPRAERAASAHMAAGPAVIGTNAV